METYFENNFFILLFFSPSFAVLDNFLKFENTTTKLYRRLEPNNRITEKPNVVWRRGGLINSFVNTMSTTVYCLENTKE